MEINTELGFHRSCKTVFIKKKADSYHLFRLTYKTESIGLFNKNGYLILGMIDSFGR